MIGIGVCGVFLVVLLRRRQSLRLDELYSDFHVLGEHFLESALGKRGELVDSVL